MTATPRAPASTNSATRSTVTPPMAMTGARTRRVTSNSRARPCGGPYRRFDDERVYDAIEALEERARARGVSAAGLALAWVSSAVSAVVGPRRPEHLEPVREASTLVLTSGEREELGSLFPRWAS